MEGEDSVDKCPTSPTAEECASVRSSVDSPLNPALCEGHVLKDEMTVMLKPRWVTLTEEVTVTASQW